MQIYLLLKVVTCASTVITHFVTQGFFKYKSFCSKQVTYSTLSGNCHNCRWKPLLLSPYKWYSCVFGNERPTVHIPIATVPSDCDKNLKQKSAFQIRNQKNRPMTTTTTDSVSCPAEYPSTDNNVAMRHNCCTTF